RVCEAAGTERLLKRLYLIRACLSVASPWTTLPKSQTTRRSQPMIWSSLHQPTSTSTTAVLQPRLAGPVAMLALEVVLPTPPLPEVTTMISANGDLLGDTCRGGAGSGMAAAGRRGSVEGGQLQLSVFKPYLHGLAAQAFGDIVQYLVVAGNGHQLGVEFAAEDAGVGIALGAGQGTAAQVAVDVDRAVGDDLGAGAHGVQDGQVAAFGIDLLARAHGGLLHPARGARPGRGGGRSGTGCRCRFARRRGRRRCRGGGRRLVLGAELGQHRQAQ